MCGILIYIKKNQKINESDLNKFKKSLNSIKHRGPDFSKYIIDNENNIIFGHNLLSITGNNVFQPIQENDNLLAYNGEIYFDKMENNSSDTLLLFEKLKNNDINEEVLNSFNGEFSFVFKKDDIIYMARDRFGKKPLYIYNSKKEIIIASEIKAFKAFINISFDKNVLNQVLTMQYHDDKTTLFKNIKPIYPGYYFSINLKNFKLKKNQYWDTTYKYSNEDNAELICILKKSILKRSFTEKKIGIPLSGGIDSSAVASLIENTKNTETYTVGFEGIYDETVLANKMSKKSGLNNFSLKFDKIELLKNLKKSIYHSEEVAINLHVAAKFLLFNEMKKNNIKVSISGEGSDEIFLGYSHLQKEINKTYYTGDYLKDIHFSDENNDYPIFINAKLNLCKKLKEKLIKDNVVFNFDKYYKKILKIYNIKKLKKVEKSNYLWIKFCLTNYILVSLGDKLEMASSIEGRIPFLDNDLVDYANSLSMKLKYNEKIEKKILRDSLKDIIIPEIINKQKHPFLADNILDNESIYFIKNEFLRLKKYNLDIIDNKKIDFFIENEIISDNMEIIILILSVLYLYETIIGDEYV